MSDREIAFLRAMLRRDQERLGSITGTDDVVVAKLAIRVFETMVARRFTPESPLAEIASFARWTRATFAQAVPLTAIVVEMVIRRELGEEVPLDDLDHDTELQTMVCVASLLIHRAGLTDDELGDLLDTAARAERDRDRRS